MLLFIFSIVLGGSNKSWTSAYSQRSSIDTLTCLQNAQEISYANSKWRYMSQHVCSR